MVEQLGDVLHVAVFACMFGCVIGAAIIVPLIKVCEHLARKQMTPFERELDDLRRRQEGWYQWLR